MLSLRGRVILRARAPAAWPDSSSTSASTPLPKIPWLLRSGTWLRSPSGCSGVGRLPEIARKHDVLRPHRANRLDIEPVRRPLPTTPNSRYAPSCAASSSRRSTWPGSLIAWVTKIFCTPCAPSRISISTSAGDDMTRFEHHIVLDDDADHLDHLRYQLSILGHARKWALLFRRDHLISRNRRWASTPRARSRP